MSNYTKRTLVHYIRMGVEASGGRWDSDNATEVEAIVDGIVESAVAQADKRFSQQLADVASKFSEHIDRLDAQIEKLGQSGCEAGSVLLAPEIDEVSNGIFEPAFYKFIEAVRAAAQEFTDTTNSEVSKLILYSADGKYHSVDVL